MSKIERRSSHGRQYRRVTVTGADFKVDVRRAQLPVLLGFWAPWCQPCGALARELESLVAEVEAKPLIDKLNVAECRSPPKPLGTLFLRTPVLFAGGNEVGRIPELPSDGELNDLVTLAGHSSPPAEPSG